VGGGWPGQCRKASFSLVLKRFGVAQIGASFVARPGIPGIMLS
jgi:hypothetical protein